MCSSFRDLSGNSHRNVLKFLDLSLALPKRHVQAGIMSLFVLQIQPACTKGYLRIQRLPHRVSDEQKYWALLPFSGSESCIQFHADSCITEKSWCGSWLTQSWKIAHHAFALAAGVRAACKNISLPSRLSAPSSHLKMIIKRNVQFLPT